ncbi:MAG: hypothetical protein M1814_002040 [Vezdaea aestivalis]|nr:MAG: hypothetical protein M1814_002040 [Vezdaea aestivalis]
MSTQPRLNFPPAQPYGPVPDASVPQRPLPHLSSSRKPHVDGDIPPELSPLDALALQGRLLAKQLDQTSKDGRRVSRLPPTTIASSFSQARPDYLRSVSANDGESKSVPPRSQPPLATSGSRGELELPSLRPKSIHPRMSGVPLAPQGDLPPPNIPQLYARRRKSSEALPKLSRDIGTTPEPGIQSARILEAERGDLSMRPKRSFDSQLHRPLARDLSFESTRSRRYNSNALAPPGSPPTRYASSIRSVPPDMSDDDETSSMGGSFVSISKSNNYNNPYLQGQASPPISPYVPARSPSIGSEYSVGGSRLPRPQFNFSRPLSRASRPSFEMPVRQGSSDSQPHFDEPLQTPVSITGEETSEPADASKQAASYIYSRFTLPRGRALQRNSVIFTEESTKALADSLGQQNAGNANKPGNSNRPASPLSPPSLRNRSRTPSRLDSPDRARDRPGSSPGTPTKSGNQPDLEKVSMDSSADRSRRQGNAPGAASTEISAEEHLAKGIECHESGSLKESTYHLRIAAKQNHPTAMLLYALACRHGWGMRPNQREGVQWLRKAADCASLEVADDEDLSKEGNSGDYMERKTRRAQFALSIYELGVSHMKGWGIDQDKVLALRCFEIASSWGDGDAMTEAGFCYAQGEGCKKDLKKAARFYRMAEAKGVSMVGNSWIYKSKYSEESERSGRWAKKEGTEKKPRDKSRTRTMFGRKKSVADG